jgi:hypothetical protein
VVGAFREVLPQDAILTNDAGNFWRYDHPRTQLAPTLETALTPDTVTLGDVVTDHDLISPSARLSELAGETG